MNAKNLIIFAICMCFAGKIFGAGFSETNNGIYLVVGGAESTTNEPIKFNEKLIFMPFCDTGSVYLTYPDYDYSIKIKMFSPDGSEVQKTAKGKLFGSKFDQLHGYFDSHLHGTGASGPFHGMFSDLLPRPDELFVMDKAGVYTLEIQMQMFRGGGSLDTNAWSRNLIRFSPIKIKVERPLKNGG